MELARGGIVNTERLASLHTGEVVLPLGVIDKRSQWLRGQPSFQRLREQLRGETERPNGFVYIIGLDLANSEDQTVWRKANPNV